MLLTVLRFNFASPHGEPRTQSRLLSAALELAQWGEAHGITSISVDEHHATGHGWSCNPIMAAAMFLARTSTLIASVDCALGPLWNPVRLAEDIALVDNMSRGRLHTTVGLGYRTVEYDVMRTDFARRGALMDSLLERMLSVWSGPDADAGICTGTWTRPHPPLYVGGGARATARRAA
ncbi:LLM class flavin-dependent oxidoreductase, partial [Mycobacterium sp. E1715]|uniref:LLM class flavin-dependent oxidoreductase n=3 Tax=Mycobacterium TaxID=1763 RepID=UPI000A725ED5